MFNKHYISTIHPNIIKMKEIVKEKPIFDFPESTAEDINKIIKSLNPNKAIGPDHIKTAANVIDAHLAHIINKDLKENSKTLVRPFYKKDDRGKIKNYRSVNLLNGFSKIYERFLHDSLSSFTVRYLPSLFQLIESLIVKSCSFKAYRRLEEISR